MADSVINGTPKETEDSQKTETVPVSPHANTGKEPSMEDISDDEVIITDAAKRAKLEDEEIFQMLLILFHWMVESRIYRHHDQLA